jgi:hypothetical protein
LVVAAFDAVPERCNTAPLSGAQLRQARDFWEADLLPTPVIDSREAEDPV